MDTSSEYIKMRVQAIPDLGMGTPPTKSPPCFVTDEVWVDAVGDWYLIYHQGQEDVVIGCQLERQGQLQEMIKDKFKGWTYAGVLNALQSFCFEISNYDSMEQLWLAFVMKEKYGKVWNGKEWVK